MYSVQSSYRSHGGQFSSSNRYGGGGGGMSSKSAVCKYWLAGKCNRNPCRFLHPERPKANPVKATDHHEKKGEESICQQWLSGTCVHSNNCRFLHSFFKADDGKFCMLTRLEGHKKGVSGIELPGGFNVLYSGSRDGTVRVWDCSTGQCTSVINVGGEIGSLICENSWGGSWIFVGMPNVVKAYNLNTGKEFVLQGLVGQVYTMVTRDDVLFAGSQDGSISAWKFFPGQEKPFVFVRSLKGHMKPVVCLTVGRSVLYSGSMDGKIRRWDAEFKCLDVLNGHSGAVMSLLCWDNYLLSCSLDKTVLVWACSEKGGMEVVYSHKEEVGVIDLFGMIDAEDKPVMFCSCEDNSVRLYELPSFCNRGKIFAKRQVQAIQRGPHGLFFTGDATGVVSVWQWVAKPSDRAMEQ